MSEGKGPQALNGGKLDKRALDDFADRLRESCELFASPVAEHDQCPSSHTLWEAAEGELPAAQTVRLVDHLALCPHCADCYRLALEMQSSLPSPNPRVAPGYAPTWRQWMAVAAAFVLMALGLVIWQNVLQPAQEPAFRGDTRPVIVFSVPANTTLPARDFTLGWDLAQKAQYFNVMVFTVGDDQGILDRASALEDSSYTVSPSALQGIADGAEIHWKVEAFMPDGTRQSYYHVTRLKR